MSKQEINQINYYKSKLLNIYLLQDRSQKDVSMYLELLCEEVRLEERKEDGKRNNIKL